MIVNSIIVCFAMSILYYKYWRAPARSRPTIVYNENNHDNNSNHDNNNYHNSNVNYY